MRYKKNPFKSNPVDCVKSTLLWTIKDSGSILRTKTFVLYNVKMPQYGQIWTKPVDIVKSTLLLLRLHVRY